MGYSTEPVDPEASRAATQWWLQQGVKPDAFLCCFFGTLGNFFNIQTLIDAAKILSREFPVQFVLCGDGKSLKRYRKAASGVDAVLFPGWVDAPRISALMGMSAVGLTPYVNGARMSLPNKPFEYFSGELPVISSIRGELQGLLEQYECGFTYDADSVEELCSVLRALYRSPERRKSMGTNGRNLLEEKFTMERIARQFEDHLIQATEPYRHRQG